MQARRVLSLAIAALTLEAAELALYGAAFDQELVGLIAVRTVVTIVLFVFAVRGSTVGRMVLGALRVMAGLVGVVMATVVKDAPTIAIVLGSVCALDTGVGLALLATKIKG